MHILLLIFYSCAMNASITVLGNNSAAPTKTRNPSGQVLKLDGHKVLIDCGEGSQKRLLEYGINYQKITQIFISHLHGDHFLGLMGLLNTMSLNGRKTKLEVICPVGLENLHNHFVEVGQAHFSFELVFIELEPERVHQIETSKWKVNAIPVSHRIPCFAFLFTEKQDERKLNIDACNRFEIPHQEFKKIKLGNDYSLPNGEVVPNAELTFDLPKPIRYGYITDTLYRPDLAGLFSHCTAVYHETTYLHNLLDRAEKTGHSTALQAGMFAKKASVNQLLIGHFSSRYEETAELLSEAQSEFKNTIVAEEGETYTIS